MSDSIQVAFSKSPGFELQIMGAYAGKCESGEILRLMTQYEAQRCNCDDVISDEPR